MIEAETRATTRWELSAEGEEVLRDGSPEVRLFRSVPSEGLPQSDAMVSTAMGGAGGCWGGGASGAPRVPHGPQRSPLTSQKLPGAQVGFSKAMANKWLRLDKGAPGGPRIFRAVSAPPPPHTHTPPRAVGSDSPGGAAGGRSAGRGAEQPAAGAGGQWRLSV